MATLLAGLSSSPRLLQHNDIASAVVGRRLGVAHQQQIHPVVRLQSALGRHAGLHAAEELSHVLNAREDDGRMLSAVLAHEHEHGRRGARRLSVTVQVEDGVELDVDGVAPYQASSLVA